METASRVTASHDFQLLHGHITISRINVSNQIERTFRTSSVSRPLFPIRVLPDLKGGFTTSNVVFYSVRSTDYSDRVFTSRGMEDDAG